MGVLQTPKANNAKSKRQLSASNTLLLRSIVFLKHWCCKSVMNCRNAVKNHETIFPPILNAASFGCCHTPLMGY